MTRRLRELALWAGAALGLLAIAVGLAVTFFGYSFLIFRSGSMAPEIPTGAVALSQTVPAADLRAGDVVSVTAASGERITHRVVSTTLRGDKASLVLQGDANGVADSEVYVVASAERVITSVPAGGYVLAHALTPPGLVAVGAVSLMLVVLSFGAAPDGAPAVRPTPRTRRHRADQSGRRTVAAGVLALVSLGGAATAAAGTNGTLAAFTDLAKGDTATFAAATITTPATPVVSTSTTSSVTFTWSPATPVGGTKASSYQVIRYVSSTATTGTVGCTATAPTLTCTDTSPPAGITYYGLRARIGVNWVNDSAARATYTSDTTGPVITFEAPFDDYSNSAARTRSLVAVCGNAVACGEATDATGVSTVQYTFRRTFVGLFGGVTTYCWNGAAWITQNAACSFAATSGTTASWTVPGSANVAYPSNIQGILGYSYVLTIRATDGAGNVSTTPISFNTN